MMEFPKIDPRKIASWSICDCGAVSVEIDGENYSMEEETFEEVFGLPVPGKYINCNHCVNHWGIDLCACGSGEPYDECQEGYEGYCGLPMQVIGSHTHVKAWDAWI